MLSQSRWDEKPTHFVDVTLDRARDVDALEGHDVGVELRQLREAILEGDTPIGPGTTFAGDE